MRHVMQFSSRTCCRWRFGLARDTVLAADTSISSNFCRKCTARAAGLNESSNSDSSVSRQYGEHQLAFTKTKPIVPRTGLVCVASPAHLQSSSCGMLIMLGGTTTGGAVLCHLALARYCVAGLRAAPLLAVFEERLCDSLYDTVVSSWSPIYITSATAYGRAGGSQVGIVEQQRFIEATHNGRRYLVGGGSHIK